MAAPLFNKEPVFKKIIKDFFNKSIGFVRTAKSSRGVSKSDHGRPSRFGIKRKSGDVVTQSTILFKQIRLEFMPGLNVGIGFNAKLQAKVPGTVYISSEKTNFRPDEPLVTKSFPDYPPAYRVYMHVIPEPLHNRFKLVEKF